MSMPSIKPLIANSLLQHVRGKAEPYRTYRRGKYQHGVDSLIGEYLGSALEKKYLNSSSIWIYIPSLLSIHTRGYPSS